LRIVGAISCWIESMRMSSNGSAMGRELKHSIGRAGKEKIRLFAQQIRVSGLSCVFSSGSFGQHE